MCDRIQNQSVNRHGLKTRINSETDSNPFFGFQLSQVNRNFQWLRTRLKCA